jgi:hypothetical protein
MWSGTCLTSKIYDKIIKRPSKSHETIPLTDEEFKEIISNVFEDICGNQPVPCLNAGYGCKVIITEILLKNCVSHLKHICCQGIN